ncbi:pseudouridine synthase [Sphingomonas sp. PAMC 26605]|uniref:pseudouridine synthase n=1 Tax=Sphingomonas sp. PAMC 26605 TaxID=1112214 RepID=UPI00026CD103|nr:pseudouridine synthase [Sphingomonas sp. PAMC 26605]
MIAEGRVALDGVVLDTPATILTSLTGVTVDGEPVAAPAAARLFLYHKPPGLLVTERDPAGRKTIYDQLPDDLPRLVPVGRLDLNTEGLLLMTTDGELKRQLELPATGVERAYRARAYGPITQEQLEELIHGVEIEGVRYGSINANLERRTGANVWIEMILTEGKNREVRRVLEYLGLKVSRLIRTRYGPFLLGDLAVGEIGEVKQHDVVSFRKDPTRKGGGEAPKLVEKPRTERRGPQQIPSAPKAPTPKPQPARRITKTSANRADKAAFAEPTRQAQPGRDPVVLTKATKVKRFYDAKPKASTEAPAPRAIAPGQRPKVFSPELGRNVRAKPGRTATPTETAERAPAKSTPRTAGKARAAPSKPARVKIHKSRTRK